MTRRRWTLSHTLALLQLLLLAALVWPVAACGSRWGLVLASLAVTLGLWATWWHRHQGLTPLAEPRGALISGGPYACIRHPMYLSLLLFAGGMVIWRGRPETAIWAVLLSAVLVFKIRHEEALLLRRLPGLW